MPFATKPYAETNLHCSVGAGLLTKNVNDNASNLVYHGGLAVFVSWRKGPVSQDTELSS